MNRILLTLILISGFISANSQQVFQKNYSYGVLNYANDIIQTSDGGYVMAGKRNPEGSSLLKINEFGDTVWVNVNFDASFIKDYEMLAVTECSNSDLITVQIETTNGGDELVLSRLNSVGDTIWNKGFTPSFPGLILKILSLKELSNGEIGMIASGAGSVLLTKFSSTGNLEFAIQPSDAEKGIITSDDEFILLASSSRCTKVDINGNLVWSKDLTLDLGNGPNTVYFNNSEITESNTPGNFLVHYTYNDLSQTYELFSIFDSSFSFVSSCIDVTPVYSMGGFIHFTQTKDDSIVVTQSNNGFSGEFRIAKLDSAGNVGASSLIVPTFMGSNSLVNKIIPTNDSGAVFMGTLFMGIPLYVGKIYKGIENGDCDPNNPFLGNLSNYSSSAVFSSNLMFETLSNESLTPSTHSITFISHSYLGMIVHDYNNFELSLSKTDVTCPTSSVPGDPIANCNGEVFAYVSGGFPNTQSSSYNYTWINYPAQQLGSPSPSWNLSGICSGWVYVSVTDSRCNSTPIDSIFVGIPDTIEIEMTSYPIQCSGTTVTASAIVSGGTTPYNYSWYDETASVCSGCETPSYLIDTSSYVMLQITDANNCAALDSTFFDALLAYETPICMVSVDSTSTKNVIVWSKPASGSIDHFNIYRDIVGTYTFVASVPYDSLSQFVDTTNGVNPNITQYRYKISNVDTCGYESPLSDYHQTIYLSTPNFTGSSVELNWQAYDGFDYNFFYRILRDSMSTGDWEVIDSVSNTTFVYSDIAPPGPNIGTTRYLIEIAFAGTCDATKAANYSSSRSNRPTTQGSGVVAPVANFTANTTTISEGSSIVFTDQSTNNPTSWAWTFDGGTPNTSTAQNPGSILYSTAGTYNVSLTVGNSAGTDDHTKVTYITVVSGGLAPTADFLSSNTTIVVGDSIQYSDISTNLPTSWAWAFEGGTPNTSTAQNPGYVVYNAIGTYNVTLTATNAIGSDQEIKTAYVTVVSAISGDINGNGTIDSGETAGDLNNDGIITGAEMAGDLNGNGIIDGNEIAGDINGNGTIDTGEIAGDVTGDGEIGPGEFAGDLDGNGLININEVYGDANGNGVIDNGELSSVEQTLPMVDINIYPNPNNGYFVMELSTSEKAVIVNIYNNIGQRVLSEAYQCNGALKKEYDISQFGAGIYNVEININGQSTSKRLVVK